MSYKSKLVRCKFCNGKNTLTKKDSRIRNGQPILIYVTICNDCGNTFTQDYDI